MMPQSRRSPRTAEGQTESSSENRRPFRGNHCFRPKAVTHQNELGAVKRPFATYDKLGLKMTLPPHIEVH